VRPLPIPHIHNWMKMEVCLINFNKGKDDEEGYNTSAGFTYRLYMLKLRASKFRGTPAKV
jgi:hypothetical protein